MKKVLKCAFTFIFVCCIVCACFMLSPVEAAEEGTMASNPIILKEGVYHTKTWTYSNYKAECYNKITVPERGYITFSMFKAFENENEIASFDFVLYNADGKVVWAADCYEQISSFSDSFVYNIGLDAGVYYMNIDPFFYIDKKADPIESKYKYEFTSGNDWEIESNGTFADATKIEVGKTYNGVYCEESYDYSYEDCYSVYLNKGVNYVVSIENYTAMSGASFNVYSAAGNKIEMTDKRNDGKATKWNVQVGESGTYCLKLYDGANGAGVAYKIAVNRKAYSLADLEFALSKTVFEYDGKAQKPVVSVKTPEGTALTEGKDYVVKHNNTYKAIGNYIVTVELIGEYSGSKQLAFSIVPKKVAASGIKATQTTTSISLSWGKVSQATGYRVYQYSPSKKKYVQVASVKTNSFNKTGLKAGTTYKFKIKAYKKLSDGTVIWAEDSAVFTTATKCAAPKITLLKSYTNAPKVKIAWDKVEGATGYQVYYSTTKNGEYKKIALKSAGSESVTKLFSSSASGKKIYFKVRAYAKVGSDTIYGDFSAVKSAVLH